MLFVLFSLVIFSGCTQVERKPLQESRANNQTVREPGSVPTPVTEIPTDILEAADYYASAIGHQDWERAKVMSSPRNLELLEKLVKIQLTELSSELKVSPLVFDDINFEAALLVKENYDDMIITESLSFKDRKLKEKIYLKFHILKQNDKIIVDSTEILRRKLDPRHKQ